MPIYGYNCKECKNEYEVFYTSRSACEREEPAEKCPKCGSTKKARAVPKRTGFVLKGKGWYKDGYK